MHDLEMHDKDRHHVCDRLAGSLEIRYSPALSDPSNESSKIFAVANWPSAERNEGKDLEEYGNDRLLARITARSAKRLRLQPDLACYAIVKTLSIRTAEVAI